MHRPRRCGLRLAAALLACLAAPAAPAKLTEAEVRRYAGDYSTDCRQRNAPRLRVQADRLMRDQDGRRLVSLNVVARTDFHGAQPPAGFAVALVADREVFEVYTDRHGPYIRDDKERRFRRCALRRNDAADRIDTDIVSATPVNVARSPAAFLGDPVLKSAYLKLIGSKARDRWLARFEGDSPPLTRVSAGGISYVASAVCKKDACTDHRIVVLHAQAQGLVYAKLQFGERTVLLGSPPPAVAEALERLWTPS